MNVRGATQALVVLGRLYHSVVGAELIEVAVRGGEDPGLGNLEVEHGLVKIAGNRNLFNGRVVPGDFLVMADARSFVDLPPNTTANRELLKIKSKMKNFNTGVEKYELLFIRCPESKGESESQAQCVREEFNQAAFSSSIKAFCPAFVGGSYQSLTGAKMVAKREKFKYLKSGGGRTATHVVRNLNEKGRLEGYSVPKKEVKDPKTGKMVKVKDTQYGRASDKEYTKQRQADHSVKGYDAGLARDSRTRAAVQSHGKAWGIQYTNVGMPVANSGYTGLHKRKDNKLR